MQSSASPSNRKPSVPGRGASGGPGLLRRYAPRNDTAIKRNFLSLRGAAPGAATRQSLPQSDGLVPKSPPNVIPPHGQAQGRAKPLAMPARLTDNEAMPLGRKFHESRASGFASRRDAALPAALQPRRSAPATPAAAACRTPCLPPPGCAGPQTRRSPDLRASGNEHVPDMIRGDNAVRLS